MNERIKLLAEQALKDSMVHDGMYRPNGYANGVSKDFADKFAELIVKDCALTIGLMEQQGRKNIGAQLLDNFGVKE